ncbi:TPA: LPXTG cell wall anchor domain-containing protein [Streptococcus suis]
MPNLGNTKGSNLLPNTGESAAGYLSLAAGIAIAAGLGLVVSVRRQED